LKNRTLIVVAGPTAVGKTALSIRLAQQFGTSIISADSRQCYREMQIGTAKPSAEELAMVPHYFINTHSIHESINAADFEQLALGYLDEIFSKANVAVLCGGTGLYIKALCEGIDEMPNVDPEIEKEVKADFEKNGLAWLQAKTAAIDAVFYAQAEQQNPVRLIRGLSFYLSNNISITAFQKRAPKIRNFDVIKIGLDLPRSVLYQRINDRVDQMMQAGLMEEVNLLYPHRAIKNLQTVGYAEFYEVGAFPLNPEQITAAVEKVKQHTRNYAKRQLTWFRKDKDYTWFAPDEFDAVLKHIACKL
jgi:tRNA dimethylallyltransferase